MAHQEITMELIGFQELEQKLAALGDHVAKNVARHALREAAKPVLARAKELCPVSVDGNHGNPPGMLRGSLKIRAIKGRRSHAIGVKVTTDANLFEGDSFYGGMIEFGTHRMAAEPFLRPALDQSREQCLSILQSSLRAGIAGQASFEAGLAAGLRSAGLEGEFQND